MYGVPTNRAYSWRTSECVASAEVDSCISSTGGITASLGEREGEGGRGREEGREMEEERERGREGENERAS
jgi:hypothetical protein